MNAIQRAIASVPNFIWDGNGFNPYFGILGMADYLVVTCDSVNMISEALATGKPVNVANLPGGSPKFESFHRRLLADGLTRVFAGALESYSYPPPDDAERVTERIRELIGDLRGRGA